PGPQFPPQGRYHWYDGGGMLQSVRFERGRGEVRNRRVRTGAFEAERAAGRSLHTRLQMRMPEGRVPDDALEDPAHTDGEVHPRWVRTEAFEAERAAGRSLHTGLKMRMPEGRLPDDALKNTANTDVKFHAGRLLSMWYRGGAIYRNDPRTLETLGKLEPNP